MRHAGIRIHDVSARSDLFKNGFSSLPSIIRAKPTSVEIPQRDALPEEAKKLGHTLLSTLVATKTDLERWFSAGDVELRSKMMCVDVRVPGGKGLGDKVDLVKEGRRLGMQVRFRDCLF